VRCNVHEKEAKLAETCRSEKGQEKEKAVPVSTPHARAHPDAVVIEREDTPVASTAMTCNRKGGRPNGSTVK